MWSFSENWSLNYPRFLSLFIPFIIKRHVRPLIALNFKNNLIFIYLFNRLQMPLFKGLLKRIYIDTGRCINYGKIIVFPI